MLNTLFSGLAFGGVVVALILQHREIVASKQEQQESKRIAFLAAQLSALGSLVNCYSAEAARDLSTGGAVQPDDYFKAKTELDETKKQVWKLLEEIKRERI